MSKKDTSKRKTTPIKKRSQSCYNKKVKDITKWYDRLEILRKELVIINPNTKQEPKRKELKSLSYYIDQIKKVYGG